MSLTNDIVAFCAFALIGPAVVFIAALCLRQVLPPASEPARTAERIVGSYAAHPQLTLWVVLILMPLSAFVIGIAALLRTWGDNPKLQYFTWRAVAEIPEHWPALSIGGATLLALGLLVMITAHLMSASQGRRNA